MISKENNFAYIDASNLYKGINELGWELDYQRFRVWLREKYSVKKAYLFLGLIPRYKTLYTYLQEAGFTLVFKEMSYDLDGKAKGNCDADLVLRAVSDVYEDRFKQAVLVTGDGDFASLVQFLKERDKLRVVLAPDNKKCSILIKRINVPITYLNEMRQRLSKNEKAPDKDGTL